MNSIKFLSPLRFFLLSALVLTIYKSKAQCVSFGSSLATSYVSNNSNKGEMFNVVATNAITVLCFDLNLILGSNGNYEIYYKVGSYVGSETNAAAWTLIGSNPSVACVGFDVPSPMNIPINVFIPAGQTYAFYVTATNTAATTGIRYTNNSGYTTIASDANVTIAGGIGKSYPFGANFANRSFNGTIHYGIGNVLPVELVSFFATPANTMVRLNWSTASETNHQHFTIERSHNGIDWTTVKTVQGSGKSEQHKDYEQWDENPLDGFSYYRLSQTDINGTKTYFEVKSVNRGNRPSVSEKLSVSPNPASNFISIKGSRDELGGIQVFNLLGEDLSKCINVRYDAEAATLDLSALENQMFMVKCGNRSVLVIKS